MADAAEMLARLIAFDTTSRNSNLALIGYAQEHLELRGARVRLSFDAERNKANLFATFGDGDGGIVLSGHTDVVPVDGQDWSSDPFTAEVRNGLLYGRGSADMKGFIACVLVLADEMAHARLARPLHIALSYDEEVGCAGVTGLLADLAAAGIKPELAVIGEPTLMRPVGAHKGGAVLTTHCRGREGHSSKPHLGANAAMMAGEMIAYLAQIGEEQKANADPRFDPPYTTVQANQVNGGTASNVLARDCEVVWEYRTLPNQDGAAILKRVQAYLDTYILPRYRSGAPEAAFDTTLIAAYPGLAFDEASPAGALACELTGINGLEAVAYGTEAGHFQEAGIPAVICGPGSIDQAHKADEFVALSELAACTVFVRKLIARASA